MPAIRFEQVSKEFILHHERPRSLQELFLNLIRFERTPKKEKYWALRDVSFEVSAGEMVGIVGPNGAGKSTALKLITRIIEPTSGQIQVNGRVGALLELGSGFHPDLTGRENVYLNGSILGFGRAEMDRLFDDIVSFSEMERFIDVPVKHYSSGMYMRLGFSVAMHLEPEILLVDEILAVGDQAFQFRCLDRINEMKRQKVTILLVSHNLDKVQEMCDRAIWLDEGMIQAEGPVEHVLERYMTDVAAADQESLEQAEALHRSGAAVVRAAGPPKGIRAAGQRAAWRWGSGQVEIVRVQLLDGQGKEQRTFRTGETLIARIHYSAHEQIEHPQFGVALHRADGFHIAGPNTVASDYDIEAIEGDGFIDFMIPQLPLTEGAFLFSAAIYNHEGTQAYDHHHQAYTFRVPPDFQNPKRYGTIHIACRWQLSLPSAPTEDNASHEEL
jgi:lipopolysaccharide transport system ATP-binding protein